MSQQESKELTVAIAEPRFRLGLHCANEALVHLGLIQFPARVAQQVASLPLANGERLQTAKSLNEAGMGFRKVCEWDNALHCYERALLLYEQCGDRKFCGHMHYNRGVVLAFRREASDLSHAQQALTAALRIYLDLGMKEDGAAARKLLSTLANS